MVGRIFGFGGEGCESRLLGYLPQTAVEVKATDMDGKRRSVFAERAEQDKHRRVMNEGSSTYLDGCLG